MNPDHEFALRLCKSLALNDRADAIPFVVDTALGQQGIAVLPAMPPATVPDVVREPEALPVGRRSKYSDAQKVELVGRFRKAESGKKFAQDQGVGYSTLCAWSRDIGAQATEEPEVEPHGGGMLPALKMIKEAPVKIAAFASGDYKRLLDLGFAKTDGFGASVKAKITGRGVVELQRLQKRQQHGPAVSRET